MNNLPAALTKHEKSSAHIQCQIMLKIFGKSRIDLALDEQRRLNITSHNEKVKENREVLKVGLGDFSISIRDRDKISIDLDYFLVTCIRSHVAKVSATTVSESGVRCSY